MSAQSNTSFPWALKPKGHVYFPQGPDSMAIVVVYIVLMNYTADIPSYVVWQLYSQSTDSSSLDAERHVE